MLDKSAPGPAHAPLSLFQRRRLAALEHRLDTDEPALAAEMRRGLSFRRVSPCRVVAAGVVGVPVAILAASVGGAAVAVVTATNLLGDLVVWARPRRFS